LLPVDVLVCAPHPDDETVGTAGVIQHAVAAARRVRVVFVTNGDGYPRAAAALLDKPLSDLAPPAAECQLKLQALTAHASQYAVDRIYLESFVKSKEVFWRPR
jgi:LmbE family N-acetylglucosaminyl deacetylase